MSEAGFDFSELDQFSKNLILKAQKENPKEVEKFLRKEGGKMRTKVRRAARRKTKKKTGNYLNSIDRDRPRTNWIRVYSKAPHALLIEDGHRLISHGKEVGFVLGKHVFRDAEKEFKPIFERDVDAFAEDFARRVEK